LHGPPLDLGATNPDACCREVIATIDARLADRAKEFAVDLVAFQSNEVVALIDRVHTAAREGVRFIVIDPAGLTHTSPPLRDALSAAAIPFIEVHLTNVNAREPFRQRCYFSDKTVGTIVGLGAQGYELALTYALGHVKE
jgi:3-dehydroquinate dehydratase-2